MVFARDDNTQIFKVQMESPITLGLIHKEVVEEMKNQDSDSEDEEFKSAIQTQSSGMQNGSEMFESF